MFPWTDPKATYVVKKAEIIRIAAYYIWLNRCRMEDDWYSSEKSKSLSNKINDLAQKIMKKEPYLTEEEAWYCARDRLYPEIAEKAYYRQGWIAKCAYYLAQSNPNKSEYENWCSAAKEYDNLLSV